MDPGCSLITFYRTYIFLLSFTSIFNGLDSVAINFEADGEDVVERDDADGNVPNIEMSRNRIVL